MVKNEDELDRIIAESTSHEEGYLMGWEEVHTPTLKRAIKELITKARIDELQWVTGGLNHPEKTSDDWLVETIHNRTQQLKDQSKEGSV